MRLNIAQVVGQPAHDIWSQAVVLSRGARVELELREQFGGVFFLVVTVRGDGDVAEKGGELVRWLESELDVRGSGFDSKQLIDKIRMMKTSGVELTGVYFREGNVMLFGRGEGGVVLSREGKVGFVFRGKSNEWMLKEGVVSEGDRWFLGTKGLVGKMSQDLINEVLGFEKVRDVGEEMVIQVQALEEGGDAAGVAVYVKESGMGGEKTSQLGELDNQEKKKKKRRSPSVHLKMPTKKHKTLFSVGLVLLLLLGVSVIFGWQKKEEMEWESKYQEVVVGLDEKVESANKVKANNPLEAKRLVMEVKSTIDGSMDEFAEREKYHTQLLQKLEEVEVLYAEVSGEVVFEEVPTWYSLDLLREGMFGMDVDLVDGELIILDGQLGVVGMLGTSNKQSSLVGGGDLIRGAELLKVSGSRGVVYGEMGVIELSIGDKTTAKLVEVDEEWGLIKGMGLYAGNVYLMDVERSEIWQYPGMSRGVGDRKRWFEAGFTPDLTGAVDMVIDGDVWVLFEDGKLRRFRQGGEVEFGVVGFDGGELQGVSVYTDEEAEHVYVLDRRGSRVLKISKSGEYRKQFKWDGLAAAGDLVVDEVAGEMYVLVGSSIFKIGL